MMLIRSASSEPSEELQTAFTELLNSTTNRGIVADISTAPESLVPRQTIPLSSSSSSSPSSTTNDFAADLSQLQTLVSENEPAYIILRQDDIAGVSATSSSSKCIAVTYVPDLAPVRAKMLFASTRLTLVRELGTEHFASTLFVTSKKELTVEGWAKHEAHGSLSAPLTDEEKNLEGIREAEAQESTGTAARRGGHIDGGGLTVTLPEDAVNALERLKRGEEGLVQLSIDVRTERVQLASTHPTSQSRPSALSQLISSTTPRYSFYAHSGTSTPMDLSILFVYTCPSKSTLKERMVYASFSRSVVTAAANEVGISVAKKMEASDPDEITEDAILDEMGQKASGTSTSGTAAEGAFARPKRPGRR
ncbi:MAG: Twinfilin-1 [Alyxoria varia]|nr:MAG: Twinfilin-1 [Alyxoria varia]